MQEFVQLSASFLAIAFSNSCTEIADQKVEGLKDIHLCFSSACFSFAVIWAIRLLILNPFASWVLPDSKQKEKDIAKFAQSASEFGIYLFFSFAVLRVLYVQAWIWPSKLWWEGKVQGEHNHVTPSFKFMYLLYGGRYIAQLVSVWLEVRRKDFLQMVIHHSVTIFLVVLSYTYGYARVGAVIMLVMDPADVLLHAAKMCKYIAGEDASSRWQFAADRMFEAFALSFFITRCGMYPYIVWSATIEAPRSVHSADRVTEAYFRGYSIDEVFMIGSLWVLMFLQFFWASLLLRVAWRMLARGEPARDDRSDDEGEDGGAKDAAMRKKLN